VTLWERVDARVLAWVAELPTSFESNEHFEFPTNPPQPFAPIDGLDTRDVGEALQRLSSARFVDGERNYDLWWDLRVGPVGLV
jgi:hypothetical protein